MKEIQLTQGQVTIIDDEDFDKVKDYSWFARKARNGFYATASIRPWQLNKVVQMHGIIMGEIPDGMVIDHKDRNGLNNQKSNLRLCTPSQNGANRTPSGKSKYLGVSKIKGRERWRAFIGASKKNLYLGVFKTEVEAAIAYNNAAMLHKGEFANLNPVEDQTVEGR